MSLFWSGDTRHATTALHRFANANKSTCTAESRQEMRLEPSMTNARSLTCPCMLLGVLGDVGDAASCWISLSRSAHSRLNRFVMCSGVGQVSLLFLRGDLKECLIDCGEKNVRVRT